MDFEKVQTCFSERFKALRKEKGYTADTLAEQLGVNRKTVLSWDKGEINKVEHLFAIADLLGCDIDYLLGIQSLKTKRESSIKDITGLSEDAIRVLNLDISECKVVNDPKMFIFNFNPEPENDFINYFVCSEEYADITLLINRAIRADKILTICNKYQIYKHFKTEYKRYNKYLSKKVAYDSLQLIYLENPEYLTDEKAALLEQLASVTENNLDLSPVGVNMIPPEQYIEDTTMTKEELLKNADLIKTLLSVCELEEEQRNRSRDIADLINSVVKRFIKEESKK